MTPAQKAVPTSAAAPTTTTAQVSQSTERTLDATASIPNAPGLAAPEIAAAINMTSCDNKAFGAGVVLVTNTDPTVLSFTIAAIAEGIRTHGTIADLPVCPVSAVMFLHATGSRVAESVKSYASKATQTGMLTMKAVPNCRSLNPLVPEGVHVVMRVLKPGTCVIVGAEFRDLKRDDAIAALADLNAAAKQLGALVVIHVQHTKKQDVTWLRKYGAVCVEVRTCEQGPGATVAIVLDNLTLAGEHLQGRGRVMVEAFREADGGWTYRWEPLIAERAVIRLAWYLAREGMNLRDIAKIVGIAASNISRGFQLLMIQPKNAVGLAPPPDWRTRWAHCYDLNGGNADAKPGQANVSSNAAAPQGGGPQKIDTGLTRSTSIGKEPAKPDTPAHTRPNRQS